MSKVYNMGSDEASTWAVLASRVVRFEDITPIFSECWGEEILSHWQGEAGTAFPCGCVAYTTVLSDGSLGWGSWSDPCSIEHMD